jgi:hypothetical protein
VKCLVGLKKEELMKFPHLLRFWRANNSIFSASSFEQINAERHKGQQTCLVTILTKYPVMKTTTANIRQRRNEMLLITTATLFSSISDTNKHIEVTSSRKNWYILLKCWYDH